jgi:hypothetical protein
LLWYRHIRRINELGCEDEAEKTRSRKDAKPQRKAARKPGLFLRAFFAAWCLCETWLFPCCEVLSSRVNYADALDWHTSKRSAQVGRPGI